MGAHFVTEILSIIRDKIFCELHISLRLTLQFKKKIEIVIQPLGFPIQQDPILANSYVGGEST
jgi:hypothetical protein